MLSNGNYAQYFPQFLASPFMGVGSPQWNPHGLSGGLPGAYGANSGFGQEFGYPGLGQGFGQQGFGQQPFGPNQIGGQTIASLPLLLGQLANQVVAQGVITQQVGALLGQLAQQIVTQTLQFGVLGRPGQSAGVFGGLGGNPAFGNPAFAFGGQGIGSNFGQSPYFATPPVSYGGFAPQMQTPQSQAWNRPVGTA